MSNKLTNDFHLREFKCNDGTQVPANLLCNVQELAENLQVLRDFIGVRINLNSGYRTKTYNEKVGGSPRSQHLLAKAGDLVTPKHTPKQLAAIIKKLISEGKMKQGGVGVYPSFVHYDTFFDGKNPRRW